MEIKILDSILHGVLKPWKIDSTNTRRFAELIKAATTISPVTNADLILKLASLLTDYPNLQKILIDETPTDVIALNSHLFSVELPKYKDSITMFYYLVITIDSARILNNVLLESEQWTELIDIRYKINKTLTNIRVLTKQTSSELHEQGFTSVPDEQSDYIHFTLYCLKHSLIQLYFSIQESFKGQLKQVISLEDFYLLDLDEPVSNMLPLTPILQNTKEVANNEPKISQDRICFGFKDDVEKLKIVVNQLCYQITLLNEDISEPDDLIKVLIANSFLPNSIKIQIGCETKEFRYIIDKLQPYFSDLTLANIEKSQIFFSKKDTLLSSNNLSVSNSKKKLDPKEKSTIDRIFKNLQ